MKQMNKLLKKYGTRRFEDLLASAKLSELLGKDDDDDNDIVKWILLIVGGVICVAIIVTVICSIIKRVHRNKNAYDEFEDDYDYYGSEEE